MSNSFTKYTRNSFGGRIINSFIGAIIGIMFFLFSFPLLWISEDQWASLEKQEQYISKNAIEVESETPLRENDDKLIVTSGKLITENSLSDENLMIRNALVLQRYVAMYQWEESKQTKTRDELGGGSTRETIYTYHKGWHNAHIDSSKFEEQAGHQNPDFPISQLRLNAKEASLGGYVANELQTSDIRKLTPIKNLPPNIMYDVYNGEYYTKGSNPSEPAIGDVRISYGYAPSGIEVSILGQQKSDNTISEHLTKNGKIYVQEDGINNKSGILENIKKQNRILINFRRVLCWFFMFAGILLIFEPINSIMKIIPALGTITGFLFGVLAFLVSLALSIITIGLAWFSYRPFSAISLFLVAGILFYCSKIFLAKTSVGMPR